MKAPWWFWLVAPWFWLACSDSAAPSGAGASERDLCESVAQCIFGASNDDGDTFADECVSDTIFAAATSTCRGCLIDLSCDNLEGAFEGDSAAQAMCPACE